jgi:hypothetical protein
LFKGPIQPGKEKTMWGRYSHLVDRLQQAVLASRGDTTAQLRDAIMRFSADYSDRSVEVLAAVPPLLRPYVEKVARFAYKVTDDDIQTLLKNGYAEDALFEITVCAALGAGLGCLESGLTALKEVMDAPAQS